MTRHRHIALHLAALSLLSTSLSGTRPCVAAVEDLEAEDVPPECAQVCAPIVQLTARCEAQAEQRFGTDRRWLASWPPGPAEARGRGRKRRTLQRMLAERIARRQDGGESSDDSDDEGAAAGGGAANRGGKVAAEAAADTAMRACVCGERGFDVAGAAFGCAACVARNGTAVEANQGEFLCLNFNLLERGGYRILPHCASGELD